MEIIKVSEMTLNDKFMFRFCYILCPLRQSFIVIYTISRRIIVLQHLTSFAPRPSYLNQAREIVRSALKVSSSR